MMRRFLILSCVFGMIAAAASSSNYCTMDCKDYRIGHHVKHIGCNHNKLFDEKNCPDNAKLVPMTDSLKILLVDAHNEKRNFISGGGDRKHGPACRMVAMKWDDELAELAALNVKQCVMSHDQCHSTVAFPYSGQNLCRFMANLQMVKYLHNDGVLESCVQGWYNEVQYSNQQIIDHYPEGYSGADMGHFTVMMAENNTHVGCAAATFEKKGLKTYLVACNYAANNILGEAIYTTCNSPGVSCPSGKHSIYENLCH